MIQQRSRGFLVLEQTRKSLKCFFSVLTSRSTSRPQEATEKMNALFNKEKQRQIDQIPRVEKIQVHYKGVPEDVTLYINKGLSTPFNVAQRMCYFLALSHLFLNYSGTFSKFMDCFIKN